nr:retrovirus-related Pol polyprotein from transposon TNT 1-94 [Tanacetum cinerariifolium]
VILLKKQVAETQHAKDTVATANATKILVASELVEEQVNQPSTADAEKPAKKMVEHESNLDGKEGKENSEKGLISESFDWDDKSVSLDDEGITKIRAFMAILEDEPSVGKVDAMSGQWVDITMKKAAVKKSLSKLKAQSPLKPTPKKTPMIRKPFQECKYYRFNEHHSEHSEAEYVAIAGCYAQVLWIKNQLANYDVLYDKVPIFCDNTRDIAISNNPVLHSRTKHIDIRYHFINDHILKGDIKLYFVPTDLQLADIFTKPLAEPSFTRLVAKLAASFQKPLASEVALTSHMLKVAKLFQEPEQTLIPPSGEVNANDSANKSLSKNSMQPITQPKAVTDLKSKMKIIPPSSKPKYLYKVRFILPKKQVAKTQHPEDTVATANATKSLVAFELVEEQVNQPLTADVEKEEMKDTRLVSMGDVTFEQIVDEYDQKNKADEDKAKRSQRSFLDDLGVIDVTPIDAEEGDASDSGLNSMLDDDLESLTSFDSLDFADHDFKEGTNAFHASANLQAQSNPLGHLHEERLDILGTKPPFMKGMISFSGSLISIHFPLDSSLEGVGSLRGVGEKIHDVVLKNSLEVLKVLKNSLEVLKVLQMGLQENSLIDEVGSLSIKNPHPKCFGGCARSYGDEGGGEDRPPPHYVPSDCGGCFANRYNDKDTEVSTTSELFVLACRPTWTLISVNSCVVDDVRYVVNSHDECRTTQNSGICSPGLDGEMHYGQLKEILEFNYLLFKVVLFRVKWLDTRNQGCKVKYLVLRNNMKQIDCRGEAFKKGKYILITELKQVFYLKDKAKPHWKVVKHVNHKNFSNGGVIVVEDDPDIISFDNLSDHLLAACLNDLDNATLHIDGQSTEIDASLDIIDVPNEDDDIIDDEDALPHDLAYLDDEDLINVNDDGVDKVYSSEEED